MRIFILLHCLFTPLLGFALSTDADQVAHIQSDKVEYNNKTGIAKYTGHVHATQGTTEIDAENITLYRNTEQKITKIVALGNSARYQTLPDHENNKLFAHAKMIEYFPLEGKIVLKKSGFAQMGSNTFSGEHIIYDINEERLLSLPSKDGQTSIVIHPTQKG